MKIDLWKCDKCGERFEENQGMPNIIFYTDRPEDETAYADLCTNCLAGLTEKLLKMMNQGTQRNLAIDYGARRQ